MSATVRAMRQEDWPRVAQIYQQGIDTGIATFQTACPGYDAWDAAHLPACRLVAEAEGRVVGWAALSPVSSRPVYAGVAEVSIYVDPMRKEKGIGTLLLRALVQCSQEVGIWTLQSTVLCMNEASLRLHARCGFRTVGRREKLARDRDGVWRDVMLMEKRSSLT